MLLEKSFRRKKSRGNEIFGSSRRWIELPAGTITCCQQINWATVSCVVSLGSNHLLIHSRKAQNEVVKLLLRNSSLLFPQGISQLFQVACIARQVQTKFHFAASPMNVQLGSSQEGVQAMKFE